MRPVHLQIDGFTCFKDKLVLPFAGLDRFVISGVTGAGKSSLLDAMTFALFGQVARTNQHGLRDLISIGRDRAVVVLDFQVGPTLYRVTRIKYRQPTRAPEVQLERHDGKAFLPVVDGARRVDPEVERLLGLDFKAFTQTVLLPQGGFAKFLRCPDAERRKMLMDLLRLQVYQRMRERAAAASSTHGGQRDGLQRRLEEDFQGVSAEALAQLEAAQADAAAQLTESETLRKELAERLALAQADCQRTQELAASEGRWKAFQAQEPEMATLEGQVGAARRAEGVLPLLDQAERARQTAEARAADRQRAADELGQLETAHQQAGGRCQHAEQAAAVLPELRAQQLRLAEVVGMLPRRAELRRQLDDGKRRHEQHLSKLAKAQQQHATQTGAVATLQQEQTVAAERLAAIGYDAALDQRLDAAREAAMQLKAERAQSAGTAQAVQAATDHLTQREAEAHQSEQQETLAVGRDTAARERQSAAEQAAAAARQAHAAAHLREGVSVGDACPVCCQPVASLPTTPSLPLLGQVDADLQQAQQELNEATAEAAAVNRQAAVARAAVDAARLTAADAGNAFQQLQGRVDAATAALQAAVGVALEGAVDEPIETRVLTAAGHCLLRRGEHTKAAGRAQQLTADLALRRQELDQTGQQVERLTAEGDEAEASLAQLQRDLEEVHAAIRAVTTAADPAAERAQLQEQEEKLQTDLQRAQQEQTAARQQLEVVRGRRDELCRVADEAAASAAAAADQAKQATAAGGFPTAAAARAAVRSAAQLDQLQARLDEHRRELRTVADRVEELTAQLAGCRVTAAAVQQVRGEYEHCDSTYQGALQAQAALGEQGRTMRTKIDLAERLRGELAENARQYRTFRRLADDLQSDQFQAYLLAETLAELVRAATTQLGRLSGGRYGLDFADDQIVVIDNDNAGERRSTDSLSGGETFLASLALALALSSQVQAAVGAVHLDCLFIDEGFGTLDQDTRSVVSDAIHALNVGGRMVGVITHLPDLKDEFDQRVLLHRVNGVTEVEVEGVEVGR